AHVEKAHETGDEGDREGLPTPWVGLVAGRGGGGGVGHGTLVHRRRPFWQGECPHHRRTNSRSARGPAATRSRPRRGTAPHRARRGGHHGRRRRGGGHGQRRRRALRRRRPLVRRG